MSKLEWVGALQMLVKTGNGRNHFSLPHFMPSQIDKLGVGCTDRGKSRAETVLLVLAGETICVGGGNMWVQAWCLEEK